MPSAIEELPQLNFPIRDASEEKFNSRLVVSTPFRNKPFGASVEGLSH
jgi:hypothetical protein